MEKFENMSLENKKAKKSVCVNDLFFSYSSYLSMKAFWGAKKS